MSLELNNIYNMDCLEGMKLLPDASVDMILCDLPYGTTNCFWDVVIPFDKLWACYNRICKPTTPIVLFASQPFTTDLINSNRKEFRYELIWEKSMASGFVNANRMPMKNHENILLFYKKPPIYNPIKRPRTNEFKQVGTVRNQSATRYKQYNNVHQHRYKETGERYPVSVVFFSNWNGGGCFGGRHETTIHCCQKPLPLLKYLIQTYSNPGDVILDNCMGSGSTAIAAYQTNRHYIGFEMNEGFYNAANKRIIESKMQTDLFIDGV